MKKLPLAFCFAIAYHFFVSPISHAEESAPVRITISVIAAGKEVSELILPIGVHAEIDFQGNHQDFDEEHSIYHLTGNAQIEVKTKDFGAMTLIGDEVIVKAEHLDADKARAIADLEAMGASDQSVRKKSLSAPLTSADWALQESIDEKNMARLADIIKKYGWPGVRFAGAAGAQNAFLVLQHADSDSQHTYLPLLREAVGRNDAVASDLALLEDRVRMSDGLPQLYGSQFRPNSSPMEFWPIEDEANVDKRRAAIGLEPLADYAKRFGIEYRPKPLNSAAP